MSHQTNNTTVSHLTSSLSLQLGVMLVMGVAVVGCSKPKPTESSHPSYDIVKVDDANTNVGSYQVPQNTAMQNEPNYQQILYGQRLLDDTKRLLPNNVGADMNCNSCHIAHGKVPLGDPYINSFNAYPSYNPRAAKEVTLTERINGCFRRSMNGKPLPPQSAEMKAMLAYMQWLSKTVPADQKVKITNMGKINKNLKPNPERGAEIYQAQCASCHGDNGEGKKDNQGHIAFPPLWGDKSFNIGAGMARTYTAAAFVKYNMPMSTQTKGLWGHGGVLTDQDAIDVAEYFSHQPRPDFPDKVNDWPKGGKPKDARY